MACRNCKDRFIRDSPVEYVLHVHRAFLPQVFGSALDVACRSQISSEFAGIVLRFSRQGNCIPFEKAAAIVDAAARGRAKVSTTELLFVIRGKADADARRPAYRGRAVVTKIVLRMPSLTQRFWL